MLRQNTKPWQVLWLAVVVYLSSGAILGFIQLGWPLLLQRQGMAMEQVSLLMLLVLPFGIAVLWAPVVDRYWLVALGRRKSWIFSMQLLITLALLLAVLLNSSRLMLVLLLGIASFSAATLDLALDALLIETCVTEKHLALRGPLKVASLLSGNLAGSTASVWLYYYTGLTGSLLLIAAIAVLALAVILCWRERSHNTAREREWFALRRFFLQPGSLRMFLMAAVLVALIEMGMEAMRLYLGRQQHIPATSLSLIFGPLAGVLGIMGALTAAVLSRRVRLSPLIISASLLLALLFAVLSLFITDVGNSRIITLLWVALAVFIFTLLSGCVFSFSMLWCRRSAHMASDFALVQSAWALSGIAGAALSGVWMALAGWSLGFAVLSAGLLLSCWLVPRITADDAMTTE